MIWKLCGTYTRIDEEYNPTKLVMSSLITDHDIVINDSKWIYARSYDANGNNTVVVFSLCDYEVDENNWQTISKIENVFVQINVPVIGLKQTSLLENVSKSAYSRFIRFSAPEMTDLSFYNSVRRQVTTIKQHSSESILLDSVQAGSGVSMGFFLAEVNSPKR